MSEPIVRSFLVPNMAINEAEEAKDELTDNSGEDANFDNTPAEENRKDA